MHIVSCLHIKDHHLAAKLHEPFLHSTVNTLCSICICILYPQLLLLMLNYEFSTQSHDVIWLVEHHVTVQGWVNCATVWQCLSIMSSVYLLKGFRTQCIPELAWSGVTDGLKWTQCCLLSSPSACVSPSDPTLTVENVREVMAEVGKWEEVWRSLGVPYSKQKEIKQQSPTEMERSLALGDYWVNTDPNASWERLARVLYWRREERALAVMKQYLQQQQGMCTYWLAEIGIYILMDTELPVMTIDDYWRTKRKPLLSYHNSLAILVQTLFWVIILVSFLKGLGLGLM